MIFANSLTIALISRPDGKSGGFGWSSLRYFSAVKDCVMWKSFDEGAEDVVGIKVGTVWDGLYVRFDASVARGSSG
jgi:hypothetical protein